MAKVEVQNAVVTRIIDGYGFAAAVKVPMKNGEERTEKYTVWTDEKVREGDVVNVSGLLGVKVEEFTNQKGEVIRYAAIHVNNAQVSLDAPF